MYLRLKPCRSLLMEARDLLLFRVNKSTAALLRQVFQVIED
jgi:hypothetical protein